MNMNTQGVSIKQAISLDTYLPVLVAEVAMMRENTRAAFYWASYGEDDNDSEGSWGSWVTYASCVTDSDTNCYYSPAECRALLVKLFTS